MYVAVILKPLGSASIPLNAFVTSTSDSFRSYLFTKDAVATSPSVSGDVAVAVAVFPSVAIVAPVTVRLYPSTWIPLSTNVTSVPIGSFSIFQV